MAPTTMLHRRGLTPAGTIILIITLLVIFFAGLACYAFSKINLIVRLVLPLHLPSFRFCIPCVFSLLSFVLYYSLSPLSSTFYALSLY
jgi:hypothetical protein